ncbi:MAG TPA: pyridoxal phosphate-dependent aminotransferase [Bdellovibrionota bacterium]|nr:pyridoxal phosphate-dependent aminotransferase [Bdellovibrionota bacterium]
MFSSRTPAQYAPNDLARAIEEKRSAGNPFLDLTLSNPTQAGFLYSRDLLNPLTDLASLRYEPSPRGLRNSREALAQYLSANGAKVDPNHLWLTSSTSEAYSFLIKMLVDPGNEVLIPTPSYPLFEPILSLEGVRFQTYPIQYDRGWRIDFESLSERLTPETKALLAVNPNNPTGSFVKAEERRDLWRICEEWNLSLISDEVFFNYPLGKERSGVSFLKKGAPVPTFTMGGVSKEFGLPQMKLSWIHASGPQPILDEASERLDWIADTYLSASIPIQGALPAWLKSGSEVMRQIRARILENESVANDLCKKSKTLEALPVEGGWCKILKFGDRLEEEPFATDLLRHEGVLVQPGYFFDLPFPAAAVVSLLVPTNEFSEGLRRVLRHAAR